MRTIFTREAVKAAIALWVNRPGVFVCSLSVREYEGWAFASFTIKEDAPGERIRIQEWEAKLLPLEKEVRLREPELQKEEFRR